MREQPQIKVQTRVRVSLFVREMHGPWIWPAEVAAAHVKAEVRHLATRIDGQAASCFGGLQATESSFVATGIVCCGVVEGGGFASREQRSGWRRHPGELADFAPEVSVRVSPLFPGVGFFVTETAIFLTLRVCGLRAGLTSNPRRAEPVINRGQCTPRYFRRFCSPFCAGRNLLCVAPGMCFQT